MSRFYSQFQQVAFACFHTFGDGCQSLVYFCLVAAFLQTLQILNLFQTYSGIVHLKDIDRIFFLQTIFVGADNSLGAGVDAGLSTCRRFLDTHLGHTGFNRFRHTAQTFNFLNMFPSLVGQFISQGFHIVRTAPWVNILADVCFFLDINLSITCDTCGEVGGQCDRFIQCVGVQ